MDRGPLFQGTGNGISTLAADPLNMQVIYAGTTDVFTGAAIRAAWKGYSRVWVLLRI